jgi:hypothetical protein
MPMNPRTLALVCFYCLLWAFNNGDYCIDLSVPDYGELRAAAKILGNSYEFKQLMEKDRTRVSHYEMFALN